MSDWLHRLRDRIDDYTVDAVYAALGPTAHAALARNETTPAERATRDGSPLSTLIRLFALQLPVDRAAAERALGPSLGDLFEHGILQDKQDEVAALVDLRAYGDESRDAWLFADLTSELDGRHTPPNPDYVLGISEASSTLAQLTPRAPVGRALDLGTGCAVQSLHLAEHAQDIVATDVNERALRFAGWNATLNGIDLDLREGSFYEPVADERFDLIVTNPPFVVSPPSAVRLTYRDSGLPGDDAVATVVRGAADHLAEGGRCQILANWAHHASEPWQERLAGWTDGVGLDVWALQREVVDPAAYTEMWLADAGLRSDPRYTRTYDTWLAWFAEQRIEGIGFGWITLRATGRERPHLRCEEYTAPVRQPLGGTVAAWLDAIEQHADLDDEALLARTFTRRADVAEHTVAVPGANDPSRISLRQEDGVQRDRPVDTLLAGFVGACDGELPAGAIADALAELLGVDVGEARREVIAGVRSLVDEGFLT